MDLARKRPMKLLAFGIAHLALCVSCLAEVRTESIAVPMRDGIKLATDIHRDEGTTKAHAVLMRTPYDKSKAKGTAEKFASSLSALTIAERREDGARGENRARSAVHANISRSPSAESDIPSGR